MFPDPKLSKRDKYLVRGMKFTQPSKFVRKLSGRVNSGRGKEWQTRGTYAAIVVEVMWGSILYLIKLG